MTRCVRGGENRDSQDDERKAGTNDRPNGRPAPLYGEVGRLPLGEDRRGVFLVHAEVIAVLLIARCPVGTGNGAGVVNGLGGGLRGEVRRRVLLDLGTR